MEQEKTPNIIDLTWEKIKAKSNNYIILQAGDLELLQSIDGKNFCMKCSARDIRRKNENPNKA